MMSFTLRRGPRKGAGRAKEKAADRAFLYRLESQKGQILQRCKLKKG